MGQRFSLPSLTSPVQSAGPTGRIESLDIIIVVLESASELAEIGAGLQITPNSSRLLKGWGVYEKLQSQAVEPKSLLVHRYSGKILAKEDEFDKHMKEKYGSPFSDVHRVDLQQALVARARELGVVLRLGQRVESLDLDSIKDPDLREMVTNPSVHFWVGPGAHVVAYSLKGGTMYNIVLLVPDDLPESVARQPGSVEEMKKLFQGWDPVLTRFLECVDKVDKWKLMHREQMDSWISERGNLVMM
ncbi:putative fad binding domain protein [Neofusicoccum parvum UCRNP2]|uniref:Putative fad binding domain protein n=1 Tax=Botryosphaeria parva (strain UCR-NP2) TaxID=1287680 RepID=R1ELY3_BOTPV|nr:putative fad binding domain protein [Neofusicoccum parvum UCRNP2]